MTLLTGLAGQAWKHAAQKLDLPFLRTVVVGEPGTIDPYGYWRGVREIDEAGAHPGPPRRLRRLAAAAPRSGTTTEATAPAPRRARPRSWPSPSTQQAHAHPDAPEYSTQRRA